MNDDELADMLKTCIKASGEEQGVLIDASDVIYMINEIQRLRAERRERVRLLA